MFNMYFLQQSSLRGTNLCAAPSKSYDFSTNYHTCTAMLTWCRCAPTILFWPWSSFSLLPRSCLTCCFINLQWWVPLMQLCHFSKWSCMYCNAQMMWMCYFLFWPWPPLILFLFCSCAPTCSISNCGHRTSLIQQELVYLFDRFMPKNLNTFWWYLSIVFTFSFISELF